ncbi:MAG: hypothetical protein QM740_20725 [Acidovorax sp.]
MATKKTPANKKKSNDITVVTYGPATAPVASKKKFATADATLGGKLGWFERRAQVSPETLQTNLKSFLESMETAMKGIPGVMAGYALEEIALTLEVGAKGEIGLLGTGGELSGKGSISLKLKRSASNAAKAPG